MLIACPACGTRYVVPDDALGIEGRTVRCAKCKHSWFQAGAVPDTPDAVEAASSPDDTSATVKKSDRDSGDLDATGHAPDASDNGPSHEGQVFSVGFPEAEAEAKGGDGTRARIGANPGADMPDPALRPPPFYRVSDHEPPAGAGRVEPPAAPNRSRSRFGGTSPGWNRLRRLTWAASAFAVLAVLAMGAVSWWGVPSWLPGSPALFAGEEPGLTMAFPQDRQQTRALANGGEFLAVSGTIANTGRESRAVPPILLVLRDDRNRVVYSQEIAPPATRLAPGERREVNAAIADIPQSATAAEFGWAPR